MGKLEEFLLELETELQYLKPKDASEVLKYYRDRINIALDYGETIEHILAKLPTPQKIAAETYKSKGTDFLNIRKKQLRKKQIVNAIFSSILLFIIVVAFFAISFFLITSIVRLFNLVIASFQMNTWIDKITLFFLVVSYIFIIIIALVIVLLVCIVAMYLIDCNRMKNGDEVLFSTWGKKYAPPVKQYNDIIEDNVDNTECLFCGTITQVEENLFFVEPDEGEKIRQSSDLIMVGKLKLDTNVKYEVGERIRIFYDGTVMETYPAQIKATKYESIL